MKYEKKMTRENVVRKRPKQQVGKKLGEASQDMLKKSVLTKMTERTDWRVLSKEGYQALHFGNSVGRNAENAFIMQNRTCARQID